MEPENKKTRILKATRLLQAKVGAGPEVDEALVRKSQALIDAHNVDFAPMAKDYLDTLEREVELGRTGEKSAEDTLREITQTVMQFKANAGMFDYQLAGKLAGIMLSFLETVKTIDRDILDIIDIHRKTLVIIIGNRMKGEGDENSTKLVHELKDACKRYLARKASGPKDMEDPDAFYVDG